jgi:arylsulfatase A-like enzyme/Tfp pilus assembly protein PilF
VIGSARSRWLVAALCLGVLGGCSRGNGWNVVVVTFDTTRADHLGCYGDERASTPVVDGLAAEGFLFENAHAGIPITTPSHATIFTGLLPPSHGVRDNGLFVLPQEVETLAERLRRAGYATGAAVGSFPLVAKFGLDQGFDLYDDHVESELEDFRGRKVRTKENIFFDERRAQRVNEAVYPWLEEVAGEPFFLWIHYYDPHQPLLPPPPYDQLFAADLYAGEIAYADETLGTLFDELRRLGAWDRTLVVFTADHGEGLGEHRERTHSYLLYETTMHVPLIFRLPAGGPGTPPSRIAERVHHADVVPTILDLLDLEAPPGLDGRSLVPYLKGEGPEAPVHYAETLSPRLSHGWGELRALYAGPWKYVFGPRPELFDLSADPDELDDRVAEEPEVATRMQKALGDYLEARSGGEPQRAAAPDADTRRRLEALGYIQGGAAEEVEIREELHAEGIPPQDRVQRTSEISRIKEMLVRQDSLAARELAQALLEEDPDSPYYLQLLASAEAQLGRFEEAIAIVERGRELGGASRAPGSLLEICRLLIRAGRYEEAQVQLERVRELEETVEGLYLLGTVAAELGQRGPAVEGFEGALALDGNHGPSLVGLGVLLAADGRADEARTLFGRAVEADPYYPKAHFNLGVSLLDEGRPEEAARRFERAAALAPDYLNAYHAAGVAYLRMGDRAAAQRMLGELDRRASGSAEGRELRQLLDGEESS